MASLLGGQGQGQSEQGSQNSKKGLGGILGGVTDTVGGVTNTVGDTVGGVTNTVGDTVGGATDLETCLVSDPVSQKLEINGAG
ncbi:hypothetical protein I312_104174 [Cryptococcus bacillisporus CA1280]|uniref:uncharacterized protein n=1 Tax=Cryptococcus bacillisporus CA1280 TaxID=1296109 RepID=UPI0033692C7C